MNLDKGSVIYKLINLETFNNNYELEQFVSNLESDEFMKTHPRANAGVLGMYERYFITDCLYHENIIKISKYMIQNLGPNYSIIKKGTFDNLMKKENYVGYQKVKEKLHIRFGEMLCLDAKKVLLNWLENSFKIVCERIKNKKENEAVYHCPTWIIFHQKDKNGENYLTTIITGFYGDIFRIYTLDYCHIQLTKNSAAIFNEDEDKSDYTHNCYCECNCHGGRQPYCSCCGYICKSCDECKEYSSRMKTTNGCKCQYCHCSCDDCDCTLLQNCKNNCACVSCNCSQTQIRKDYVCDACECARELLKTPNNCKNLECHCSCNSCNCISLDYCTQNCDCKQCICHKHNRTRNYCYCICCYDRDDPVMSRPVLMRTTGANEYGINFDWLYGQIDDKRFRQQILNYFFSQEEKYIDCLNEDNQAELKKLRALFATFVCIAKYSVAN